MLRPRRWFVRNRERLFEHPVLNLERHSLASEQATTTSPPDQRHAIVLDVPDWVNVIALHREEGAQPQVIMVRQWRFGVGRPTLEIPGGMVDPGETAAEAAARELLEETGYRGLHWQRLGEVDPNPALFNNRCTTFLAQELERLGDPRGDGEEEIEVVRIPMSEIPHRVQSGEIAHALVVAAFYFHQRAEQRD